jgi:L-lysine 6-transaminase
VFDDLDNGYPHLTANLLDVVRCRRVIEIIRSDDLFANATNMGAYLRKLLGELSQIAPELNSVRGRGVWAAFDLPNREDRDRVLWACFEEELLLAPTGERSLRLLGPLDVSADAIGRAIAQLEAGVQRAYGRRG